MSSKTQSLDNGKTKFIVSENFDKKYNVSSKTIPNVPTTVPAESGHKDTGKTINWVAKYGFKTKPGVPIAKEKMDKDGFIKGSFSEKYTVRIAKTGETVWCWDGSTLTNEPYSTSSEGGKTYMDITLDKGDPYLGLT